MRLEFDVYHVSSPRVSAASAAASGLDTETPKLYVVAHGKHIVYVGACPGGHLRRRLQGGLRADGRHGYHGYHWKGLPVDVHVATNFCPKLTDATCKDFVEAVEAELVFLIRTAAKRWPTHQSEIHFHNLGVRRDKQVRQTAVELHAALSKRGYH
jgi:hypothetical protein